MSWSPAIPCRLFAISLRAPPSFEEKSASPARCREREIGALARVVGFWSSATYHRQPQGPGLPAVSPPGAPTQKRPPEMFRSDGQRGRMGRQQTRPTAHACGQRPRLGVPDTNSPTAGEVRAREWFRLCDRCQRKRHTAPCAMRRSRNFRSSAALARPAPGTARERRAWPRRLLACARATRHPTGVRGVTLCFPAEPCTFWLPAGTGCLWKPGPSASEPRKCRPNLWGPPDLLFGAGLIV